MDNKKIIVALLLIAILFSVVTLVITLTVDVVASDQVSATGASIGTNTASVILDIVENPANGGSS